MTAAATRKTDPYRRRLLAAVHAAAKAKGLDEETRRDRMERVTGKRSARGCADAELKAFLDDLNGADKGRAGGRRSHAKIRAVWLALWNLGWAASPDKGVMNGFVKSQTGVDLVQWTDEDQTHRVIEALKAIAVRECGVDWSPVRIGAAGGPKTLPKPLAARVQVVRAQWRLLVEAGAARVADEGAIVGFARRSGIVPNKRALECFEAGQLDELQRRLGRWLRNARGAAGGQ